MNNIFITIKKELRSMFRDKKSLAALFVYPLMIPVMILLYGNLYESLDNENKEYHIGIDYKLSQVEENIFDGLNLEYDSYNNVDEMDKAYRNGTIDAYISYDNDSNTYNLYVDNGGTDGLTTAEIMKTYLSTYSSSLTDQYLIEHGINLEEAYGHFNIKENELTKNNYILIMILSISLTYVILSICIATSNMAISTTATEKENGTLETLLTFPIKKNQFIIGKYLSSVIIGFIAALVSLLFMVVSLYFGKSKYSIFETLEFSINMQSILGSILVIICASVFIAGVALLLTAFAKTYKEAQSKIGLLNVVGMIPMFVSILSIPINYLYYFIPICNFEQILSDLFTNNIVLLNALITLGSTVLYTAVVLNVVIRTYNSEKILFTN